MLIYYLQYRNGYPGLEDDPGANQNFLFYSNKLSSRPHGASTSSSPSILSFLFLSFYLVFYVSLFSFGITSANELVFLPVFVSFLARFIHLLFLDDLGILGDLVEDIHKKWWYDYDLLEEHHGYIQWLFPIREHGMNWDRSLFHFSSSFVLCPLSFALCPFPLGLFYP